MKQSIYSLFILFFICWQGAKLHACVINKAVIDIGSGQTKLTVAKVDTCQNKLVKALHNESQKINYREHLFKSASQSFSRDIVLQGLNSIKLLITTAAKYTEKKHIKIVATEAFRQSINGKDVLRFYAKELGITEPKILTPEEEAKYTYLSAKALSNHSQNQIVAIDIGAGSMNIVAEVKKDTYEVFKSSELGSDSLKNNIISQVKSEDVTAVATPNPISINDFKNISLNIFNIFNSEVTKRLEDKITHPNTTIIGIGGVFNYAIAAGIKKKVVTRNDLKLELKKLLGKSDDKVPSEYPQNYVSNYILVYTLMKSLKINQIEIHDTGGIGIGVLLNH